MRIKLADSVIPEHARDRHLSITLSTGGEMTSH